MHVQAVVHIIIIVYKSCQLYIDSTQTDVSIISLYSTVVVVVIDTLYV